MDFEIVKILFAFLFGLCLGSFLNVCIYRVPRNLSIVNPPSSCPECGEGIRFYDNIPLLSYIILLGRCRGCKKPIPINYPIVELVIGLLSVALFVRYGLGPQYFLYLAFLASLVTISFIDLAHKIIPDVISLPGILVGLIFALFRLNTVSWLESVIGILGGGGFLFIVAVAFERITGKEGMGGGDVKLLAMIGAWMGWKALPFIVLISSLAGIIIGGGSLLLARRGIRTRIPFGPFLSMGALIYFFFGPAIVYRYYQFMW